MSMVIDSFASAVEMGTGEDFTTAVMTSAIGRALRFLEGVEDPPAVGLEKSLRSRKFRSTIENISKLTSRYFLLLLLVFLISICDVLHLDPTSTIGLLSSLVYHSELLKPSVVILSVMRTATVDEHAQAELVGEKRKGFVQGCRLTASDERE